MELIVSLPRNDLALASAAAAAGASALKVHMNVHHTASGTGFGTFAEEAPVIREIIQAAGIPVGLMPGADPLALPTRAELLSLAADGLAFIDIYAHHMPLWFLDLPLKLIPALADLDGFMPQYQAVAQLCLTGDGAERFEFVEASITPKAEYGQPFTSLDFCRLTALQDYLDVPLLVPTQKAITPDDARHLEQAGIGGLMIGAVVTGDSVDLLATATAAYRKVLG